MKDKIFYDHGEVTAYGTNPSGGHCGFKELPSDQAKKYFVAISSQDTEGWKDGLYCGSCVRLKYTDGKVNMIQYLILFITLLHRNLLDTSMTAVPPAPSTTGTCQITCT